MYLYYHNGKFPLTNVTPDVTVVPLAWSVENVECRIMNAELRNSRPNVIVDKSLEFGTKIVIIVNSFPKSPSGYGLGGQLVRSGTSIGANVHEAQRARSKIDFANCMGIALKEASETKYWLQITKSSKLAQVPDSILNDIEEIIRLLVSIIKKTKSNS